MFRLLSLAVLVLVSTTGIHAYATEVHVTVDGIRYFCYYDGWRQDAVADYAFASRPLDRDESRAYSIQSTVDYELKWKEKGPNGDLVEKTKRLSFKVTKISNYAFKDSKLTSISIPNTIETIGGGAFENCVNLNHISLPSSVKEIGGDLCKGCTSLSKIHLNTTITEIPSCAFNGCKSLHDVVIPSGVKKIGTSAFQNCTNLTDLNLGQVEIIGPSAFSGCKNLSPIIIPHTVKLIDIYAFYGCCPMNIVMQSGEPPHAQLAFDEECYKKSQLIVPFGTIDTYKKSNRGWSHFEHIVHSSY